MSADTMKSSDRIMLEILKEAMDGREASGHPSGVVDTGDFITDHGYDSLSAQSWKEIFETAERHLVLPMVFEVVFRSSSYEKLEASHSELFEKARKKASGEVLRQYGNSAAFLDLYEYLESEGIKPLVVKGIVCRSMYPLPEYRQSWDEDILVSPEEFEACHNALLRYGLTVEDGDLDPHKAHEISYRDHSSCLIVELHRTLFDPDSPVFGGWNGWFRDVFEEAFRMDVDDAGTPDRIWTLSPQQHLFYLICHTFKHFLYFGAGLRQITDILAFSRRYAHSIDWEALQNSCRAIRSERFVSQLFSIGEEYLGFHAREAGIPESWLSLAGDTGTLLSDVLEAGMQANTSLSRVHSSSITLDAAASDQNQDGKHGIFGSSGPARILRSLFPPLASLRSRYPYLSAAPFLLPAAWVQRLIQYSIETGRQGSGSSAGEAIRIGNERVELLRALDVIGSASRQTDRPERIKTGIRTDKPEQEGKEAAAQGGSGYKQNRGKKQEDTNLSGRIKVFGSTFLGGRMAPLAGDLWKILFLAQWHGLDLVWRMQGFSMPGPKEQKAVRENVTFIYKSFERQNMAVGLYHNIQRYYPGAKVVIADDSREPLRYEAPFLQIIHLPFNSGLGMGISMALEQVKTPYMMRMDDDELLTRKTQLGKQLLFLREHPEVDIVTMGFITVAHHHPEKNVWPAYYKQSMASAPKRLLIRHMTKLDDTHQVLGKGPNIYLARTEGIRRVGYDKNIRMIDHHDFFTRAAGVLVTVGALDSFVFHRHNPFDLEYRKYRNDTLADERYLMSRNQGSGGGSR